MKKLMTMCLAAAMLAGLAPVVSAQVMPGDRDSRPAANTGPWGPGVYMRQAMDQVVGAARRVATAGNYGLNDQGMCLMGAFLEPKGKVSVNYELRAGETYVFIGGGDEDVKDLDIQITDAAGNLVKEDTLVDAIPVVEITPTRTQTFTVTLDLFDASEKSYVAMTVMRKGATPHDLRAIQTCMDRIMRVGENVHREAAGADFLAAPNTWAIMGSLLSKGETATLSNFTPGAGNYAFVAAGDDNASDIDLHVLDGNKATIKSDTLVDAVPVVTLRTEAGRNYGVKYENYDSTGRSMVISAILRY